MSDSAPFAAGEITELLLHVQHGDRRAESRLIAFLYNDLRRIARRLLSRERGDHTLSPTALVNEAYMRLVGQYGRGWNDRVHFFSLCAQVMRHVLVDHARAHISEKRRWTGLRVDLDGASARADDRNEEILALDEALARLSAQDPRQARIVELRFFAGLTEEETAVCVGVSPRTVKREWAFAKAWLKRALTSSISRTN
jgi:RNA polymerase sigma-70 factor, ECF subfamily